MEHGWHEFGRYRVLAIPLPGNPAFTTHRIFFGPVLIGSQLSTPTHSDCSWHESRHGQQHAYAEPSAHSKAPRGYSAGQIRRRGRPRKADAERELAEAMGA